MGCLEIGATLSDEAIADGGTNIYDSVIFVLEDKTAPADLLLAEGTYLRVRYRGGYGQNGRWCAAPGSTPPRRASPLPAPRLSSTRLTTATPPTLLEFISRIEVQVV